MVGLRWRVEGLAWSQFLYLQSGCLPGRALCGRGVMYRACAGIVLIAISDTDVLLIRRRPQTLDGLLVKEPAQAPPQ